MDLLANIALLALIGWLLYQLRFGLHIFLARCRFCGRRGYRCGRLISLDKKNWWCLRCHRERFDWEP